MLTEGELCSICAAPQRDAALLCVVESPADVVAIEQSGSYRGRYFVLMGHLSPLDGIGPEQLGVRELEAILAEGEVRELILATNSDRRRRGHGALPGRAGARGAASAPAASRTACRWAASSSTSTAARSRTRSPAASRCQLPSGVALPAPRAGRAATPRTAAAGGGSSRSGAHASAPLSAAARTAQPGSRMWRQSLKRQPRREALHLDEAERARIERVDRRGEVAHPGRVDERGAARQIEAAATPWSCAGLPPRAPARRSRRSRRAAAAAPARTCRRRTGRPAPPALPGPAGRAARRARRRTRPSTHASRSRLPRRPSSSAASAGVEPEVALVDDEQRRRCRRSRRPPGSGRPRTGRAPAAARAPPAGGSGWRPPARPRRAGWCDTAPCGAAAPPRRASRRGARRRWQRTSSPHTTVSARPKGRALSSLPSAVAHQQVPAEGGDHACPKSVCCMRG